MDKNDIIKRIKNIILEKHPTYVVRWITNLGDEVLKEIYNNTKHIKDNISLGEQVYIYINNLKKLPLCNTCCKGVGFINYKKGYNKYCSVKCAQNNIIVRNKFKNTNLKLYGVDNPIKNEFIKNKIKETNIKLYGSENVFSNSLIRENIKKTNLEKYGVESPSKNKDIIYKIKNTNLSRYGVKSAILNNNIRNKTIQSNNIKYGYDYPTKNVGVKNKIKKTSIDTLLKKYNNFGVNHNVKIEYGDSGFVVNCLKCGRSKVETSSFLNHRFRKFKETPCDNCLPRFISLGSSIERKMNLFIRYIYGGSVIYNDRKVLGGKELDMLFPDINMAIELNGAYWHSDKFKSKDYHYNKMKMCEDQGIQLYQFFEDEIPQAMMFIYSVLSNKGLINSDINIDNINTEFNIIIEKKEVYDYKSIIIKKNIDNDLIKDIRQTYGLKKNTQYNISYGIFNKANKILGVVTINNNGDNTVITDYILKPGITIIGGLHVILEEMKKEPYKDIIYNIDLRYEKYLDFIDEGFIDSLNIETYYYYFIKGEMVHSDDFMNKNMKYITESTKKIYDSGHKMLLLR